MVALMEDYLVAATAEGTVVLWVDRRVVLMASSTVVQMEAYLDVLLVVMKAARTVGRMVDWMAV